MNEDVEEYLYQVSGGTCYLESLAKTKAILSKIYEVGCPIMSKMDIVLELEIDLAIMGAEKAKSEILKANKDNVKPISPGSA